MNAVASVVGKDRAVFSTEIAESRERTRSEEGWGLKEKRRAGMEVFDCEVMGHGSCCEASEKGRWNGGVSGEECGREREMSRSYRYAHEYTNTYTLDASVLSFVSLALFKVMYLKRSVCECFQESFPCVVPSAATEILKTHKHTQTHTGSKTVSTEAP